MHLLTHVVVVVVHIHITNNGETLQFCKLGVGGRPETRLPLEFDLLFKLYTIGLSRSSLQEWYKQLATYIVQKQDIHEVII